MTWGAALFATYVPNGVYRGPPDPPEPPPGPPRPRFWLRVRVWLERMTEPPARIDVWRDRVEIVHDHQTQRLTHDQLLALVPWLEAQPTHAPLLLPPSVSGAVPIPRARAGFVLRRLLEIARVMARAREGERLLAATTPRPSVSDPSPEESP